MTGKRFVKCIGVAVGADADCDLTLGKRYELLLVTPIEEHHGLVRVVDDSGEDYLYPKDFFEI
jgi:hypothetical protein